MTTLEMEVALMKHFDVRRNLIVPNVSFGMRSKEYGSLHECDLLVLSKSNYATEIEIKVSKSDLLKDFEKGHGHDHNLIKNLYYAVPSHLQEIALEVIPKRSGLLVVDDRVKQVKSPISRSNCIKWSDKDRLNLMRLGCMRIFTLKKNVLKLKK